MTEPIVIPTAAADRLRRAYAEIKTAEQRYGELAEMTVLALGADIVNEQWTLNLDTGLLERVEGQPEGLPTEESEASDDHHD